MRPDRTRNVGPTNPEFTPVVTERVKTSIIVERRLMREAQELSRVMGISYNGFINMAIYEKIRSLDSNGSRRPPADRSDEVSPFLQRRPRPHRREDIATDTGFSLPSDQEGVPNDYASWPDVERYAAMQLKHPTENFDRIARRLSMSLSTARAADVAQESEEYARYLKRKAKGRAS